MVIVILCEYSPAPTLVTAWICGRTVGERGGRGEREGEGKRGREEREGREGEREKGKREGERESEEIECVRVTPLSPPMDFTVIS